MTTKQPVGATVSETLPPDCIMPDPPKTPDMRQRRQLTKTDAALLAHFKARGDDVEARARADKARDDDDEARARADKARDDDAEARARPDKARADDAEARSRADDAEARLRELLKRIE